jgi:carbamoyl-phosphate synthase small subunit
MTQKVKPALLALEDGTTFRGVSVGAEGESFGEVVFQTALTGYQEVLTDPSYCGQIVVMTAPEMGNVGVNLEDEEAPRLACAGFVMREASPIVSNWRAKESLSDYLRRHKVVSIAEIDTRALTRRLRTRGAMRGAISTVTLDPAALVEKVKKSPSMEGLNLVDQVTTKTRYVWDEPSWVAPDLRDQKGTRAPGVKNVPPADLHVVAYDYGIKRNILRKLRDLGCKVTVLPAQTPASEALAIPADGYFLSNGPGDPAAVTYAAEAARALVDSGKPVFGICLGHQILGLALGGKTYKLTFGHHGANHPVKDLATGKVEITSQNHGFAVDVESLAGKATLTHVHLNDQTVAGMELAGKPVFSVQYHPEASPGPHDADYLFDRFIRAMRDKKAGKTA